MIDYISHIPYNFSFCRGTFGRVLYTTSTRFSLQSKKVVNQHFIGISSKQHINVSFKMISVPNFFMQMFYVPVSTVKAKLVILKQTNGLFIKTE